MRYALALSAVCGAVMTVSSVVSADIIEVRIYNLDFSAAPSGQPATDAIIAPGDTIRWKWAGGLHDTTSVAGQPEQWQSPLQSTIGATYDHTFTTLGVSQYYCSVHGGDLGNGQATGMAGKITVTNLNLDKPVPGTAGANNTVSIHGANPGDVIDYYYAFKYGNTSVTGCSGLKLSLATAVKFGSRTANANGDAALVAFVPATIAGRTVVLQAVNKTQCTVSTLEQYTFP